MTGDRYPDQTLEDAPRSSRSRSKHAARIEIAKPSHWRRAAEFVEAWRLIETPIKAARELTRWTGRLSKRRRDAVAVYEIHAERIADAWAESQADPRPTGQGAPMVDPLARAIIRDPKIETLLGKLAANELEASVFKNGRQTVMQSYVEVDRDARSGAATVRLHAPQRDENTMKQAVEALRALVLAAGLRVSLVNVWPRVNRRGHTGAVRVAKLPPRLVWSR